MVIVGTSKDKFVPLHQLNLSFVFRPLPFVPRVSSHDGRETMDNWCGACTTNLSCYGLASAETRATRPKGLEPSIFGSIGPNWALKCRINNDLLRVFTSK